MAIASGVDANADTVQRAWTGHEGSPQRRVAGWVAGKVVTRVARKSVSLLREIFGLAISWISGRGPQDVPKPAPKPEGTIFFSNT